MVQPDISGVGTGKAAMLFGSDGSRWIAVRVDNAGHPHVDVESYPGVNALGNIPFGYAGRILEEKHGEGDNGAETLDSSSPPADEVWVITSISIWHTDATARRCRIQIRDATTEYEIAAMAAQDRRQTLDRQGYWILLNGDFIRGIVLALPSGEHCYMSINGYKCKIS